MSDAHRGPGSLESRGAARAADVDDEELEAPLGPLGRLTSRFGKKRRQRAKERAGRAYYRQYEAGKPSDASQAGPRAAVYKGEMGASHRPYQPYNNGNFAALRRPFRRGRPWSALIKRYGRSRGGATEVAPYEISRAASKIMPWRMSDSLAV